MRYELRITAYDVMDMITLTVRLTETNGPSDATASTALHMIAGMQGKGVSDPREWVQEVVRTIDVYLSEAPPSVKSWGRPSGGSYTISGVADTVDAELD